ncbi:MAG: hypothetical protein IPJ69_04210 [Deltaproteobacteria bacterium]|nr:MAG: hypothetical protein IPJ69_04210 [Deltaproteobacteria bacterium]
MKNKRLFLIGISFFLIIITPLTGLWAPQFSALLHPVWALVVIPILIVLQVLLLKTIPTDHQREIRIETSTRYALILGLGLAFFSGLGVQMGFFPKFFHQLIIWPLVAYFMIDSLKNLS